VASFDPEGARRALGLEADLEPVTAVALGYPEGELSPREKTRKPLGEVWEKR
jgi:nitroreductase